MVLVNDYSKCSIKVWCLLCVIFAESTGWYIPVIITGMDKEAFFQMFLVDLIKTIEWTFTVC